MRLPVGFGVPGTERLSRRVYLQGVSDDPSTPVEPPAALPRIPCPGGAGKKRQCWAVAGGTHCRNHDPALDEARRQNGAKRVRGPDIVRRSRDPGGAVRGPMQLVASGGHLVPGVTRAEHPNPTKREIAALMVESLEKHAREILAAKVPGPDELRDTAIKVLYDASLRSHHEPSRVRAAQLLVALTSLQDSDKRALVDLAALEEDENEQAVRQ
jgi:hypothetical protein